MTAWAAEAVAAQPEPFYVAAEFWVMVAFFILLAFASKPLFRIVVTALDARAATIKSQLDEAARLREEAQGLLATYQRQHRDAVKEAGDILGHARDEAARQAARAEEILVGSLRRRERMALERIAQMEARALDEVRGLAVDIAIDATRRALTKTVTGKKAHALIADAIKELPKKLN
jgi:F-type H+-transporting ATPase subunit b